MDLAIMIADLERTGIADLERTGYAEVLQEQSAARPAYHEYYKPEDRIVISQTSAWGYSEPTRYLSLEEQQVFARALRRSVKVVHKAGSET